MNIAMLVSAQCAELGQALGWTPAGDPEEIARADGLVFVLTDYYTRDCWEMKKWLEHHGKELYGKLCGIVIYCPCGGGGDLATRSILSQLLPLECRISLCAIAGEDGMLRIGGSGRVLSPKQYHREFAAQDYAVCGKQYAGF